ncbi:hypothetical protein HELRODRAFT_74421, partial [Helobdella robusta]|uniref:Protein kinase domain-containing protein n=1 Tax=Helobdella robusta TaxID=6412 RepID=T1G1Q8_HELRO
PELVKNEEYGEKVDIWSLGCLLYLMCKLEPPFVSKNMLALSSKVCICVIIIIVLVLFLWLLL